MDSVNFSAQTITEQRRFNSIRCIIGPFIRRSINICSSAIGLILLSPLLLFIALLIKLDTPGPVFFRGRRVGKKGRIFKMVKFRTMFEDPQSYAGPKITGQKDLRITGVGGWLRDTKLNELPQLWNVFKGNMNLVGPRPEDPNLIKYWPEEQREILLSVNPGITSPASIVYSDEEKLLQSDDVEEEYRKEILPEKLRLDVRYVKHRSILSDFDVIFLTLITLLPAIGKNKIPDHVLIVGPLSRFISHYFSWFFIDTVIAFFAIGISGFFWRLSAPLDIGWGLSILTALTMALIFSIVNYILGLSRMWWSKAKSGYVLFLFVSSFLAVILLLVLNQFIPQPLPNDLLIFAGVLAWFGFVIVRYRLRLVTGLAAHWLNIRPGFKQVGERVLIVGAGDIGHFASTLLVSEELLPAYTVVGMVDDDPRKIGLQLGNCRVLGPTNDIRLLVEKYDVELIVFAIAEAPEPAKKRILDVCRQTKARIVFLPDVIYSLKGKFLQEWDKHPVIKNLDSSYHKELGEIDALLQDEQISEARQKISDLRSELADPNIPNFNFNTQ